MQDCRQQLQDLRKAFLWNVDHQSYFSFGGNRALEHQGDIVYFLAFPVILVSAPIGNEPGGALQDLFDNPQTVGPQGTSRLGDFDDGVGQLGWLDLCSPPTELDLR